MSVSVTAPFSPAMQRTSKVLFQPFDLAKWVVLGFCAWLAQLGDGGGGFSFPTSINLQFPFPGPVGGAGPVPQAGPAPRGAPRPDALVRSGWDWVQAHALEVIGIVAAVVLVSLTLWLVFLWLKARGVFLFLDGVVRNRPSVGEPWTEYAREGNSLFRFLIGFSVVLFLLPVLIIGLGVGIALPDLRAMTFGNHAVIALAVAVLLLFLTGVAAGVAQTFLYDFVVPIMYLRRQGVLDAWGEFRSAILPGRVGMLILYLLFKVVLGLDAALAAVALTCATCCIAAIPFVGTVILLPLSVFFRAYSLYFLEQFGPEWTFFPDGSKPGGLIFEDLPPPPI